MKKASDSLSNKLNKSLFTLENSKYKDLNYSTIQGLDTTIGSLKQLVEYTLSVDADNDSGNLQGVCIVDDKIYSLRNVKYDGAESFSPDEKGRIYVHNMNGEELEKSDDIDKFAHQGFSYFYSDGDLYFMSSGGTDDGETKQAIEEYSGATYDKYVNAGKKVNFFNWTTKVSKRVRVMADYDDSDPDTYWYASLPYVDVENGLVYVIFNDLKYSYRKKIVVYTLDDILNGNEDDVTESVYYTILNVESNTSQSSFSSLVVYNNKIYISNGKFRKFNKSILIYDMNGNLRNKVEYFPKTLLDKDSVEPEGMCMLLKNGIPYIYSGIHTTTDGEHTEYLLLHGAGDYYKVTSNSNVPGAYHSSASIDFVVDSGNTFNVFDWDVSSATSSHKFSVNGSNNLLIGGSYITMKKTKDNADYNRPIAYSTDDNRSYLSIRSQGYSTADGAGINLYGKDDEYNAFKTWLYTEKFYVKDQVNDAYCMTVDKDEFILPTTIRFGLNDTTYRVMYKLDNILQIRAKDNITDGGSGINLYDKDSDTNAGGIKLYVDSDNGANLVLEDLPTSDPGVSNAVWNDGGTLKISAG